MRNKRRIKPQEKDQLGDLQPNVHSNIGFLKLTACEGLDLNLRTQ
jgi:hypothetical protein